MGEHEEIRKRYYKSLKEHSKKDLIRMVLSMAAEIATYKRMLTARANIKK